MKLEHDRRLAVQFAELVDGNLLSNRLVLVLLDERPRVPISTSLWHRREV